MALSRFVAAAALFCLLPAGTARADPFRITAGALFFSSGPGEINISGPDFSIVSGLTGSDEFGLPGLAIATADPTGNTLPVSGHIVFDVQGAIVTLASGTPAEGVERVLFDVVFTGAAAPTTVGGCPDVLLGTFSRFECAFAAGPFAMTGQMSVLGSSGAELLQREVTGGGTAIVGFVEPGRGGRAPFAEYRFEAAATTPEPGTLLLVLSGVLAVSLRFRRTGRDRALLLH